MTAQQDLQAFRSKVRHLHQLTGISPSWLRAGVPLGMMQAYGCAFRARFVKIMSFFCFLYKQGTIRRVGERLISVGIKKCARTEVWGTMVNS